MFHIPVEIILHHILPHIDYLGTMRAMCTVLRLNRRAYAEVFLREPNLERLNDIVDNHVLQWQQLLVGNDSPPLPYFPLGLDALSDIPCPFTPSQADAVRTILFTPGQQSFFLTGGAGTGKSHTLRHLTRVHLGNTLVAATTATAAVGLDIPGACTVHRLFKLPVTRDGNQMPDLKLEWPQKCNNIQMAFSDEMCGFIREHTNDPAIERVFIIDEVSMLGGQTLGAIMRHFLCAMVRVIDETTHRKPIKLPWLLPDGQRKPPARVASSIPCSNKRQRIGDENTPTDEDWIECYEAWYAASQSQIKWPTLIFCGDFYQLAPIRDSYAFESPWWKRVLKPRLLALTENMRQRGPDSDAWLATIGRVRNGTLKAPLHSLALGGATAQHLTALVAKNDRAAEINRMRLKNLGRPIFNFHCKDEFREDPTGCMPILDSALDRTVSLAVGALIIITRNYSPSIGLYNSATAIVKAIGTVARRRDPTEPRWERIDDASSDITWLDGASAPRKCDATTWEAPNAALEIELLSDRVEHRRFILYADVYKMQRPTKSRSFLIQHTIAERHQLFVKLGWAITIHRAQGMTLERGILDPRGLFADGQAYVAVSRFQTQAQMYLECPLEVRHIRTNYSVKQYYRQHNIA